jgi:hypothetical protein
MEFINAVIAYLQSTFGEALWVLAPLLLFIGSVAQARLYAKADQPAISAIVPVWNFIVFMKVIGRPLWHSIFIIAPLALMLGVLFVDFADIFAFSQGGAGFEAVSLYLPLLSAGFIVFSVFMIWAHIDLCNSFGRRTVFDYVLVVVLNILYVLNLGLSYEIRYEGPSYGTRQSLPTEGAAYA